MADNFKPDGGGSLNSYASDEIDGVHYPRQKLIYGADGTNDGDVATDNPLPVRDEATAAITTTADVSIATVTKASVKAANTSRKAIMVSNLAACDATCRVGDTNTGATRGIPVAPGQTVVIPTTAEVFVYNASASTQTFPVTELI